ncbi:MAG: prepilin peptidase [Candidatus Omnitrophica bacterium]|nr:prepilin peptidase [Candidatus Omnitrophota bacterium]
MDKLLVFIVGAVIGSFLNVCIYRIPKRQSIVRPPSHCPHCGKRLRWYHNIPVLSYIALRARCAFCGKRISARYPLVELVTAALLTALFVVFGPEPKFFSYSIMTCALIAVTFIDLEIQEIPDEISLGGIVAGILFAAACPSVMDAPDRIRALLGSIAGAAAGGGSIFILKTAGNLLFRKKIEELGIEGAMGDGDIKLMAMIGAFLGLKLALLTFFMAPFFGVLPGIIAKFRKGAETIPYGPFLSMAALVAVFYGGRILSLFFF